MEDWNRDEHILQLRLQPRRLIAPFVCRRKWELDRQLFLIDQPWDARILYLGSKFICSFPTDYKRA